MKIVDKKSTLFTESLQKNIKGNQLFSLNNKKHIAWDIIYGRFALNRSYISAINKKGF